MREDIDRMIDQAVRKIEVLKRTEAKFAEAMRKQDSDHTQKPRRTREP